MTEISLAEGLVISIGCIITVFIVLVGLQFILSLFKFIKADAPSAVAAIPTPSAPVLAVDAETEEVAMLTALILANGESRDKKYEITEIKRIK
ncbi:OadG family protein [Isobaculum melis]|uniref:Oxaloacetate decarboxylase, gamma chain n=1 Tax=Isobaculum melis TaxID=142588 RepID=A0A1H9TKX4_9LACT|nr:OadG family protein [Isobaculum melis]SER97855.1 Oxaloacetate decarboxylase, gamma chain [Isobaculum melis]